MEALKERFLAANTQVLGVSVDSVHCHLNWAASWGGVSYPLLADFQPRGALASSLGLFLEGPGITDRATVIIDADGIVRFVESVTSAGKRDPAALLAEAEEVNAAYQGSLEPIPAAPGFQGEAVLYARSGCPFCRSVIATRDCVGLKSAVSVRYVDQDEQALKDLEAVSGGTKVPCLVHNGDPVLESAAINARLVNATCDWAL